MREGNLKRQYGIGIAEYDAMLAAQGGVCAICHGQASAGRRLHVDHCHATGKVRGLLCDFCNNGLGRFYDRVDLLEAAIGYLGRA